jgi:hypothetical protein
MQDNLEQVKSQGTRVGSEVKKRTVGYIMTAFGLVVALAWNDAIKAFIDHLFPAGSGISAKFIYAAILTIAIVIVSTYLIKEEK